MSRLLERLFPARSLVDVDERGRVRVRGEIVTPDAVRSPMTGLRGAAIRYEFANLHVLRDRRGQPTDEGAHVFAAVWLGGSLTVRADGLTVAVPLEDIPLALEGGAMAVTSVSGPVPPPLDAVLARFDVRRGALGFREHVLRRGDALELHGVVERLAAGGSYRERAGAATDFRLLPGQGAHLVDVSLSA